MLSEDEIRHIRDVMRFMSNMGFGDFSEETHVLDVILEDDPNKDSEAWLHVE